MNWLAALALLAARPEFEIVRTPFGVPHVVADTREGLFRGFGRAAAQDRLWQMETTRRTARGRMAGLLGPSALASDRETVKAAYTDVELQGMFDELEPPVREAFEAYAEGVNEEIRARTEAGTLPPGYAQNSAVAEPWSPLDSCAIAVMLARRFGGGGAGELRNLALLQYLKGQPCKDRFLDVFDDLAWLDDPRSPTTADREALPTDHQTDFPRPSRSQTEAHLARVPSVGLLELLPAVRAATGAESRLIARAHSGPFETGSYCIVVGPGRSRSGRPLLLTGPQMGHTVPSVVHEVVLDSPGLCVAGVDVPGLPCVVVGHTPDLAWGLTTGVADTGDVVFAGWDGGENVLVDGKPVPLEAREAVLEVKGQDPVPVRVERTEDGPVLLKSRGAKAVFSQRTSYWRKELASTAALFRLYEAKSAKDLEPFLERVAVNFNLFFAFRSGEVGWRYTGAHPVRNPSLDPRLPIPAGRDGEWRRIRRQDELPRVDSPRDGLITNWNNKPVPWWPNGDTPAWGRLFRVDALRAGVPQGPLSVADLERAVWSCARAEDATLGWFYPHFVEAAQGRPELADPLAWLLGFDGTRLDGSPSATLYLRAVAELRRGLFQGSIGNLTGDALFETAVQPSVIANALEGTTAYPFLRDAEPAEVLRGALLRAWESLGTDPLAWPAAAPSFPAPSGPRVPYSNRGTYIQVTEMADRPFARSVCPPGVEESGPHSANQTDLARTWTYKPVPAFRHAR